MKKLTEKFLFFTEISKLKSECEIIPTNIYDTKIHSLHKAKTIYEIKSVVEEPYFTVRQKHQLTVINLRADTLKLLKIHSDIPLVSSAVDSSMKLLLINAKQQLQVFSLVDAKPICEAKLFTNEMSIDNWTSVRFIDPNRFVCVSRKVIAAYDVRQPIEPVICHDLTSTMGLCEDLTCLEQSINSYNTFITTTHKLKAFDMRNINDEITPTLTWVHQLKTAPVMMDISKKDEKGGELIAIAGIKSGDVKVFDTTMCGENAAISTHLPYTPVSVHDSFKYARNVGKFLDPNSLVQLQLRQSNTGLKWKRINSSKFYLLTKNTCGDVFQQEICERKEENFNHEPIIDKLVDWDNELRRRGERENKLGINVTDMTNFQSMNAYLRSHMHKTIDKTKAPSNSRKQDWEMSIEELASYQDVLANSLLDKWVVPDIAEDIEMDEKYTDDRMNNWVESTVEQFHIFEEDICVKGEPEIQEY